MKKCNFLNNQKGFTLLEVFVAMAVFAVFSLGLVDFLSSQNKEMNYIKNNLHLEMLKQEMILAMGHAPSCEETFLGLGLNDSIKEMYSVKNGTPTVKFKLGDEINRYKIDEMTLTKKSQIADQTKFDLFIRMKAKSEKMKGQTRKLILPIYATIDSDDKIETCYSPSSARSLSKTSCDSLGGFYDEDTRFCLFNGEVLSDYLNNLALGQEQLREQVQILSDLVDDLSKETPYSKGQQKCTEVGGLYIGQGQTKYCHFNLGRAHCEKFGGIWQSQSWPKCQGADQKTCEYFGGVFNPNSSLKCIPGKHKFVITTDDQGEELNFVGRFGKILEARKSRILTIQQKKQDRNEERAEKKAQRQSDSDAVEDALE